MDPSRRSFSRANYSIAPEGVKLFAATNAAGDAGPQATDEAVIRLIARFDAGQSATR